MKNLYLVFIIMFIIASSFISGRAFAGNEQRAAESGAAELLINPWARSSGWGDANVSCIAGIESVYQNIAGLAFTRKTELVFSHTWWFQGADIAMNAGGFATRVGGENGGVLGISVMSMNFGEIETVTVGAPEGGIGTFSPTFTNIALSYAREFSNSIYGGVTVRLINESIANANATAFSIDAGIQYVTGLGRDKARNRHRDNLRFGITMKNVGSSLKFDGDGLAFTGFSPNGTSMTVEHRRQEVDLPSLIKIGASYHFKIASKLETDENGEEKIVSNHNLIIAANFTSNSYTKDQIHLGVEYNFMDIFFLRGGYCYEKGIESIDTRTTAFTGPSVGTTVQAPLGKGSKSMFALDYSYRFTNPFGGVHTFGVRVSL
jgi:hypothetical protein